MLGKKPRLLLLTIAVGLLSVLTFASFAFATSSSPDPKPAFGKLKQGTDYFLVAHFDQRSGTFDPDSAGIFDDGADVKFVGDIKKLKGGKKATVEASAVWNWGTYLPNHPSALVYNKPITMPDDHKHAGCTIVSGGTHTFTGMVKITTKKKGEIHAKVMGGDNNERHLFSAGAHSPGCDASGGSPFSGSGFDATHNETENEVLINFEITGGTDKFAGATGNGDLQFTYNTKEPHELLSAAIILRCLKANGKKC